MPPAAATILRRGAIAGAAAALAAAAAAGLAWHLLLRRPLPRTRGELRVAGIEAPVRIRRDRWGVPHISARSRRDLWFGQGFCHGQDRLWQLDFYRRVSGGRLAEVAGEAGVATDRLIRTLGLRSAALREEAELAPRLREELDAYCAGVNAAARTARARPFELQLLRLGFEPWRPADMLAIAKLLAFGLSTNWERELMRADLVRELGPELAARLDPTYPPASPVVLQEAFSGDGLALAEQIDRVRRSLGLAAEASGSNNWAVSPRRSATGTPLIAGDPHLSPGMPGIWYQVRLELGGRFAHGASLPGSPGVWMGQNNDVAWTFTNAMADVQDLYVERVEGDAYLFEDDWLPLEVREEEIAVRGREEPLALSVRATRHGPLVNEALGSDSGEPLALRWITLDLPAITRAQLDALDARSGEELVGLLAVHTTPVSNLVWADRHGSIGYKTIGALPLRAGGVADLPKPGWSGEHEWEGVVPYEELPELRDPESGYVVTANNRIEGDGFAHHVTSEYLDGYRARRIETLLEAEEAHDLDGFARMQMDLLSIPGLEVARRLSRLSARDQRERRALELLRSWDGRMAPDSVAATIYQAFLLRLAREFARAVVRDRDLAERYLDRAHNGFLSHVTSPWRWHSHLLVLWEEGDRGLIGRPWDELVLDALRGALGDLAGRFGSDPSGWRWGEVHAMDFPHPLGGASPLLARLLNRRLHPGGAQETVNQVAYDPNDPYRAVWGPSWRMVADAADPERARWQAFTGQSGHPGSRHYDDLQRHWSAGRLQPAAGEGPWEELELLPG